MKLLTCLAAGGILLSLTSCGLLKPKKPPEKPKKPVPTAPALVGRIASKPEGQRFVLIQSYGKWEVPASSVLTTRGEDERVANLLATGETLGQYAAADVQSGSVEVGDAVYYRQPVKAPEPPPEPETPAPSPAPATPTPEPADNSLQQNVQKNN